VYCNTWLAVGIFRADKANPELTPVAAANDATTRAGALGRVIYLTPADFAKLEYLATIERNPRNDPLARTLVDKLSHAVVVSARDIPRGVMTVNSSARIVVPGGWAKDGRTVTLRHPGEGGISVASPLGLALLGLAAGESAIYSELDGSSRTVTVERVLADVECAAVAQPSLPPQSDDDDPGPSAA
jgi:regulator of nucleoside diphosphate kinase